MEIKPIEEKAYARMRQAFEDFAQEVEQLCGDPAIDGEWLDNEDVCLLLNINKRTLQHYRDYGTLAFSRIGNKCYYKTDDVENLIAKSQIK